MTRTQIYGLIGLLSIITMIWAYPLFIPANLQRYVLLQLTPVETDIEDVHKFLIQHNYIVFNNLGFIDKSEKYIRQNCLISAPPLELYLPYLWTSVIYWFSFDENGKLTDIKVRKCISDEWP